MLAASRDMDLLTTLDNYVHRLAGFQQVQSLFHVPTSYFLFFKVFSTFPTFLIVTHVHVQIHTIFRANWHYTKDPLDPFTTFKGLDK